MLRTDLLRRKASGNVHLTRTVHAILDDVHGSEAAAWLIVKPLLEAGLMTYRENAGSRIPLPIAEQYGRARAHIRNCRREWQGDYPCANPSGCDVRVEFPDVLCADCQSIKDDAPDPEPEPEPEPKPNTDAAMLIAWIRTVQRAQVRDDLDPWGMRQALNGARLLNAEMPLDAIKDAFTIDFDADFRAELGVREFDLMAWAKTRMLPTDEMALDVIIRVCEKAQVNLAFVGGKGIGKTTSLERVSERENVTLAVVSCSPESSSREFYGVQTLKDFVMSEMTNALLKAEEFFLAGSDEYVRLLLDEADCLDSPTAKMLNRMLEQKRISHPFLGRTISFGNNLRIAAAMNTTGGGGNEDYTAGERQDASFLDRFFRVRVALDVDLQDRLFWSIING